MLRKHAKEDFNGFYKKDRNFWFSIDIKILLYNFTNTRKFIMLVEIIQKT